MSAVRSFITKTLAETGLSRYEREAESVIDALEEREATIARGLRNYAMQRGVRGSDIDQLFVDIGLVEPEPEPEPETFQTPTSQDDVAAALARIERTLDSLTRFARDNGYQG